MINLNILDSARFDRAFSILKHKYIRDDMAMKRLLQAHSELLLGTLAWTYDDALWIQSRTERIIHCANFYGCDCKGYSYKKGCYHKLGYELLKQYVVLKDAELYSAAQHIGAVYA
jgi:hypothetical protein